MGGDNSKPWRVSPPLDSELLKKLRKKVEDYSIPPHLNAKQSRILMMGPVGGGKSSFFNTIKAIFQERMVQQAMIGKDPQSLTKTYRQYEIQYKGSERTLNFRLCDTRGIEPTGRPHLTDLTFLLDGNVPDKYEFGEKPIDPNMKDFISQPKPQDKIHCVAFVFEASSLKVTSKDIWEKLKQLQIQMNTRGIPGVILLTKIDKLSENVGDDASKVFFSNDVKEAVEYISEKLDVAPGNVMPIKNYENEIDLDDKISCLALQALDRMLGFAIDGLVNQHDRR